MVIFLLATAFVAFCASFDRMGVNEGWRRTVFMDGRGYYSYLPALCIYNDPSCSFYSKQSAAQPDSANFMNKVDGKTCQ